VLLLVPGFVGVRMLVGHIPMAVGMLVVVLVIVRMLVRMLSLAAAEETLE